MVGITMTTSGNVVTLETLDELVKFENYRIAAWDAYPTQGSDKYPFHRCLFGNLIIMVPDSLWQDYHDREIAKSIATLKGYLK